MSASATLSSSSWQRSGPGSAQAIGLWAFIGVASSLFALFVAAYVMRMSEADAIRLALPWQLAASTLALAASSLLFARAARAQPDAVMQALRWAGACALAFIALQVGSWQALLDSQVTLRGNPAGSFFFLLTAMHGLHLLGGLVAWWLTLRALARSGGAARWRVTLCARYWHFLLAVWLLLLAMMAWITPERAAWICGRS